MTPRILLLLALCAPSAFAALSCKDENNKDVDWFVAYKLPKTKKRAGSDFDTEGTELAYLDSNMKASAGWKLLKADVFSVKGSPLAHTLAGLYKGSKPKNLYAVYNDQPPENYNGTAKGHTKGVLQFAKDGGFWLQHSVPRYPFDLFSKKYEYPNSGLNNGQAFMCVSFGRDQLTKIAAALRQQYPYIYEGDAPAEFRKDDEVNQLLEKNFVRKPKDPILIDTLKSVGGTEFRSFAKHQAANEEVYSNVIGPKLDVDLLVQSWRNGAGGKLGPTCPLKGVTITNLVNVILHFQDGKKIEFKTTEDHAKWAVSTEVNKPWFCIGSLNRMLSQYKRGGQTTCILNKMVHKAFTSAVDTCEMCDGPRAEKNFCKKKYNE